MLVVGGLLSGCVGSVTQRRNQVIQQRLMMNPSGNGVFDTRHLPSKAQPYAQWLNTAGSICDDVTVEIVAGVITVESNWDPLANQGKQNTGYGIAQFQAPTWQSHGVDADGNGEKDVFSAADAIVSAGHYLCFLADAVKGHLAAGRVPGLQGRGSVRDLMIVAYNKGPNIWLLTEWNGVRIHFDADGIPDAKDGNGLTGQEYLRRVNAAINSFRSPGTGGAVVGGAREAMKQAALAEVGTPEVPMGSNCQKYTSDCFAWCAAFASWIWKKGGFKYYSTWVRDFYKFGVENRSFRTDFQSALPGDTLIYDKPADRYYHIGVIVEVYPDGTIATVEGNSSNKVTFHSRFDPHDRNGIGYVAPIPGK